jgi:hypothetical protein
MNAAKLIFYQAPKRKNVIILVLGIFFFSSGILHKHLQNWVSKRWLLTLDMEAKTQELVGVTKIQEKDVVLSVFTKNW